MKKQRVFAVRKNPEKPLEAEAKWSFEKSIPKALAKANGVAEENIEIEAKKYEIRLLSAKSYCSPSGLLRAIEDGDYVTIFKNNKSKDEEIICVEVGASFRDYLSRCTDRSSYSAIKDYDIT